MQTNSSDNTKWAKSLKSLYGFTDVEIHLDKRTATRDEWLHSRTQGIGGSEIGKILGHSKYGGVVSVWMEKVGRGHLLEAPSDEQLAIMENGTDMEEMILELYKKKTGRKVVVINAILKKPNTPFLVNVDAIAQHEDGTWGVLEIKNTLGYGKEWKDGGVPESYKDQCWWGMWITGLGWGEVVSLRSGRWSEHSQHLIVDDPKWKKLAEEKAWEFAGFVENKILPPCPTHEGSKEGQMLYRGEACLNFGEVDEKEVKASPKLEERIQKIRSLKDSVKEMEEEVAILQGFVVDFLGAPGTLTLSDGSKMTLSKNKPTSSFNRKAFAKEHPDLEKAFCEEKEGAWVLRDKK
jgi:putative phage-type endonuclease